MTESHVIPADDLRRVSPNFGQKKMKITAQKATNTADRILMELFMTDLSLKI